MTQIDITKLIPSDLLEHALNDFEVIRKTPGYEIDMSAWHKPNPLGYCEVCLAGAVMANTLNAPRTKPLSPASFDEKRALQALDEFRRGYICDALLTLKIAHPASLPVKVPVTPYDDNPDAFLSDMRGLVKLLREHGI